MAIGAIVGVVTIGDVVVIPSLWDWLDAYLQDPMFIVVAVSVFFVGAVVFRAIRKSRGWF